MDIKARESQGILNRAGTGAPRKTLLMDRMLGHSGLTKAVALCASDADNQHRSDKIRDVIGPGGKVIRIIELTGTNRHRRRWQGIRSDRRGSGSKSNQQILELVHDPVG